MHRHRAIMRAWKSRTSNTEIVSLGPVGVNIFIKTTAWWGIRTPDIRIKSPKLFHAELTRRSVLLYISFIFVWDTLWKKIINKNLPLSWLFGDCLILLGSEV